MDVRIFEMGCTDVDVDDDDDDDSIDARVPEQLFVFGSVLMVVDGTVVI